MLMARIERRVAIPGLIVRGQIGES
jgi:hypothetical protein